MSAAKKKLIIFDVDGVIFKSYFLLEMSRRVGLLAWLKTIFLCFLLESGKAPIDDMVRRVYRKFRGLSMDDLSEAYNSMKIRPGAKDAVRMLRDMGYRVVLVSAGAPDFIVRQLSDELEAGGGFGMEVVFESDSPSQRSKILTGEVKGELVEVGGKVRFSNKLLAEINANAQNSASTWDDIVAVGDDRNNLETMRKAGLSIGVNASYSVRREADFLLDNADLTEIPKMLKDADAPKLMGKDRPFDGAVKTETDQATERSDASVRSREVFRKFVHAAGALVPFAHSWFPALTLCSLVLIAALYALSEWFRLNGVSFPLISKITRASVRKSEARRFAFGPLALAAGVVLSLLIFPIEIAYAVILIVALADPAACLIGRAFGAHPIPYNKSKSIEGSLAAIQVGFIASFCYMHPLCAIIAAFAAGVIESLPLRLSDNLTVPMGAGAILWLAKIGIGL